MTESGRPQIPIEGLTSTRAIRCGPTTEAGLSVKTPRTVNNRRGRLDNDVRSI